MAPRETPQDDDRNERVRFFFFVVQKLCLAPTQTQTTQQGGDDEFSGDEDAADLAEENAAMQAEVDAMVAIGEEMDHQNAQLQ